MKFRQVRMVAVFATLIVWIGVGFAHTTQLHAQELIRDQAGIVRSATLYGALPDRTVRHYLGLEPFAHEQKVVVMLTFYPATISAPNLVNILVLSDHGLRRHLAGVSAEDAALFQGGVVPFDETGNKRQITFTSAGRGNCTVIVFNKSDKPINYRLDVQGAVLVDDANQTRQFREGARSTASPVPTSSTVAADRLSGELGARPAQHYLGLQPAEHDSVVTVKLTPVTADALIFYILTEDGLRRVLHGGEPENVSIATGFQPSYRARFQISGRRPYTVVVVNLSDETVRYELAVEGGLLLDTSGQMQVEASEPGPTSTTR